MRVEETHTTRVLTPYSFNLSTVLSQSDCSMGVSPSVTMIILRVHVRFESRYCACVSIATMTPSSTVTRQSQYCTRTTTELTICEESLADLMFWCWLDVCEHREDRGSRMRDFEDLIDMVVASVFGINNVVRFCTIM